MSNFAHSGKDDLFDRERWSVVGKLTTVGEPSGGEIVISLANIGWCCSTVPSGPVAEVVLSPVDRDVAELTRLVTTEFRRGYGWECD
ncbi:MAG: hypothetical protein K8U57_32740 [Planctomycetes bacterium]|nr:hypothetical protein [Planctomycetota bacterium]